MHIASLIGNTHSASLTDGSIWPSNWRVNLESSCQSAHAIAQKP